MGEIDALLKTLGISSLTANDVPVYDSVAGKFKKASGIPTSSTFLRGDGTWANPASNSPGTILVMGTKTAQVSTSGTTFAAGADVLTAALSFAADGSSHYLVHVAAIDFRNSTAAINDSEVRLNLDGADGGIMGSTFLPSANNSAPLHAVAAIVPSAATHTVNVRVVAPGGGTAIVDAGVGGAGVAVPAVVWVVKGI